MNTDYIPLKVLIIDPIDSTSEVLAQSLAKMRGTVLTVKRAATLGEAKTILEENDFNTEIARRIYE
jgi:hypothetical protein